jgi:DNA-binding Lrp family transcriptional regulator
MKGRRRVWSARRSLRARGNLLPRRAQRTGRDESAAVTGTANLLVTVTCRDLAALYAFVTAKAGTLSAVRQAEIVPVLHRLKQAGTRVRDGRLAVT